MRAGILSSVWTRAAVVALTLAVSLVLVSAEKPVWTANDKAYYADAKLVDYVRPGLVVKITNAEITADFTIKAWVKFTDPMGVPLDLDGIETPGVISAGLIAAVIPDGQRQYTAYTVRTRTNSSTGFTATQATSDSGGTWQKTGPGEYLYTFGTKAPATLDRSLTHSIGLYARRDLTEFDLGRPSDDDVFTFVPNGSPVTVVRDVVRTESCNRCHQDLTAHGRRHSVELCVLCHTPQSTDATTENTVDFKVMIHRIHAGAELPSVQDGTPYKIGNTDFSEIEFPADVRRCQVCHDPDSGAKQADAWLSHPNRAACGACHDNVNFASGVNHAGGPQVSDNLCAGCHIPEGELEFDASIIGAHTISRYAKALPGLVVKLVQASGAPGGPVTITYTVTDKAGNPLNPSQLNRLQLTVFGPTTDILSEPISREDARNAPGGADGRYVYTTETAMPEDATGSWAVGVEARNLVTLLAGKVNEMPDVRDAAYNDVIYFSVDGSPVEPRRTVVDRAKCNNCHFELSLHGDNRKNPQYCVACHRPNRAENGVPIDFRTLVHKIHAGGSLERPYVIGNNDFSFVEFPGVLQDCETSCHTGGSQELPLSRTLSDVTDPSGYLNPVGPTAAACLACHDSIDAASHALVNTSALGESCAACHGQDKEFSVDRVHAQ